MRCDRCGLVSKASPINLIAAFFFGCLVAVTAKADEGAIPIPGCGEAATFSLLCSIGRQVTLEDVHQTFRRLASSQDERVVSIHDIRQVLTFYGVATKALKFDKFRVADVSTPCILFIRPGRWFRSPADDIGHFVTLVGFTGGNANVLDWSGASIQADLMVPRQDLESVWEGDAIVIDDGGHAYALFFSRSHTHDHVQL